MSLNKINTVVAGATGYVGLDLINILSKHPKVKLVSLCAQKSIGKNIKTFDKRIKKKLPTISKLSSVEWKKIDLLFLSLPNGEAQKIIKQLFLKYKHLKFIDLSADFRLENAQIYKKWYKKNHKAKNLIKHSKYSIAELVKNLKNFRIVANPGCYPTSIQLALMPIIKKKLIKTNNITIDSKSGFSGAGKSFEKKFKQKNLYSSTFAYGIKYHRHMSELDQEFFKISKKLKYTFNPHVIPTFRGILSSIYLEKKINTTLTKIHNTIKKFYKNSKFVKVHNLNKSIGSGTVLNTNYCEISICSTIHKNKFVIFSAIDNLIKGAAGQAVQNMNLLYGFRESLGLGKK